MHIETKVYKFNATKKEVQDRMARLNEDLRIKGRWIDENHFHLQKANAFFFELEGDITQLESNQKIIITINLHKSFLLFYLIPLAIIILGIFQYQRNEEISWLLMIGGVSTAIFIYLVASAIAGNLKKYFKEEFQLM